jgi:acetoin utilization protein AcuC
VTNPATTPANPIDADRVAVVWDESMLGYKLSESHPLHPVRLDLTMRLARGLGVLEGVDPLVPAPAPDEEIRRIHVPSYLDAVKAAPSHGDDPAHQLGTSDNPIFEGMHESSALVCGGSIAAAREIAEGRADRAVNIAGGLHHAMADHAWGFCVYNDCAVAISWLLDHGYERIAYLDTDVHHGDGVQQAFLRDPRVLTISMHQHPRTLWPGTGFASELGDGPAAGTAVNLALPPGTRDRSWLRAFHAVVPSLLGAFRPQVLVTQCGADTHHEDPLAELALTVDGHRAIYQACRDLAAEYADGKWLALGGGGYGLFRAVPRSWTHLLATVLDRDVDPNRPLPAEWIAYAGERSRRPLPTSMTEDAPTDWSPWGGVTEEDVDRFLLETRRAVFPLHGLDPQNYRD